MRLVPNQLFRVRHHSLFYARTVCIRQNVEVSLTKLSGGRVRQSRVRDLFYAAIVVLGKILIRNVEVNKWNVGWNTVL